MDIVERLNGVTEGDAYASPWTFGETCKEAAAEITRLRAIVELAVKMREKQRAMERLPTMESLKTKEDWDNALADVCRAIKGKRATEAAFDAAVKDVEKP